MKLHPALAASSLLAVALVVSTPLASADPVITDVNGAATPAGFIFGIDTAGWKWTAPQSFLLDGLGSTFFGGANNVLPPSHATLLIATDTPANGGMTLFTGSLDGAGHASFADIAITAGTTYFIGYSALLGPVGSNTAVGLNIVNFVPQQPPGTVNLNGWYTGANFQTFTPQIVNGQLQVFSAPILRFEGHLAPAVPEPGTYALMALGLLAVVGARMQRQRI